MDLETCGAGVVREGGEGLPSSRSLISSLATGLRSEDRMSSMSAAPLYSCIGINEETGVGIVLSRSNEMGLVISEKP
jgi:hypothetical protein